VRYSSQRHRSRPNRDTNGLGYAYRRSTRRLVGYRATRSIRITERGRQCCSLPVERSRVEFCDGAYAHRGWWILNRGYSRRHIQPLAEADDLVRSESCSAAGLWGAMGQTSIASARMPGSRLKGSKSKQGPRFVAWSFGVLISS